MTLTFGSLFAGIGGFDLGFEKAGMQCKWQVEIDDYATRVLERHWPSVRRWRDITTFPPDADEPKREVRSSYGLGEAESTESPARSHSLEDWSVDLICGGFPCQDISYAGKGAGLEGERSGLFYEAVRVIRTLGPRYVVLENVAALLTRGLPDVLGTLASVGYDTEWHCIPAAAVGAPHIRDRVFIIGYLGGHPNSCDDCEKRPRGTQNTIPGRTRNRKNKSGEIPNANSPRLERQRFFPSGAKPQFNNTGDTCWWATEPAVGRVANGIPRRVDRLRGLGNAVVPQVAQWIGERIIAAHEANQ